MSIQSPANLYTVGFGAHPQGVEVPVVSTRDPSTSDHRYPIGKRWINSPSNGAYVLTSVSVSSGVISANWEASTPGTSEIDTLTGDSGGAISPDGGTVILAGGSSITTVGTSSPGTITFNLDNDLIDIQSITGDATFDMNIVASSSKDIILKMGDASGTNKVSFIDSGDVEVASINSDGDFSMTDLGVVDLTATGTTQILGNSASATTVTIASGVGGNTVSVANAANTSAQTINLAGGASGANSTVNILSGNGTAGTQTLNALTGTRAGALNLGTGAAAHVIAVGSASAGAITVDTAAGISIDAATASNLSVSGAGDLTLAAATQSVNITGAEAAADAVLVSATNASGGITLDAGATPGVTVTNGTQSFQVLAGSGSPNGSVTAAQGSLYVDVAGSTSTTILFCNTDGSTTWVGVGA